MSSTAVVTDKRFQEHDPGPHHPESPQRLRVLERLFSSAPYSELERVRSRHASEEELGLVHTSAHIAGVAASRGAASTRYDADTAASSNSFDAARLAVGGAIELADAVCDRGCCNGFAALRPPGHHAESDQAMGFCLFNNVAIVARHLQVRRGVGRVLIVDWDVHHGNGSQHTFYDDPSVMYISLHQYPFYPGSGAVEEIGVAAGVGTTVNIPMPAGAGDAAYTAAFREIVLPAGRTFSPDFVLVSAGFDAHRDDPLASIELSTEAYANMTNALIGLAEECAGGRLMLVLEGGYDLRALHDSVAATVDALSDPGRFAGDQGELTAWGQAARSLQSSYWKT